jgi:hypothetical protein
MQHKMVTYNLPTKKGSHSSGEGNPSLSKGQKVDAAVELRYRAIIEQIPTII